MCGCGGYGGREEGVVAWGGGVGGVELGVREGRERGGVAWRG